MNHTLAHPWSTIKLLILDVDGVLTDGKLYYSAEGEQLKCFHVHDGAGIKSLLAHGVKVAIISARQSAAVTYRMKELGIQHLYQGQSDKTLAFNELCKELQISAKEVAYIGDDVADLPVLKQVGIAIAVANAVPIVKEKAHYRTEQLGGHGAVREVCELIISHQQKPS